MAKIPESDLIRFPDISEALKAKEERRKELAKLPVAKKLKMVTKLRDSSRMLKASRRIEKQ